MKYVRAISSVIDWDVDNINLLPIKAFGDLLSESDSDISIFEIDDFTKSEKMNRIILKLLASNPSKFSKNCDIVLIDEDISSEVKKLIKPDDKGKIYGTLHCNIKDVKYQIFQIVVEYIQKNRKNAINYSPSEITDLIKKMSDQEYNNYLRECCGEEKRKAVYKQIRRILFSNDKKYHCYIN